MSDRTFQRIWKLASSAITLAVIVEVTAGEDIRDWWHERKAAHGRDDG